MKGNVQTKRLDLPKCRKLQLKVSVPQPLHLTHLTSLQELRVTSVLSPYHVLEILELGKTMKQLELLHLLGVRVKSYDPAAFRQDASAIADAAKSMRSNYIKVESWFQVILQPGVSEKDQVMVMDVFVEKKLCAGPGRVLEVIDTAAEWHIKGDTESENEVFANLLASQLHGDWQVASPPAVDESDCYGSDDDAWV